ncbi:hypothetical protein OJ997_31240 [Solirubrobacter phytolaccae]|uniref:Uncharacterized protein n=1 Tax=Solirubrobacter phytolaccae TaxID=1404360 RepID=A0A9X3SAT8_9ACTN|nr:hypothetical protein [Solirubrobacter phytolaccae]MDA0184819.1 hypothetical protein [Solirubrobacter phytolaccae]
MADLLEVDLTDEERTLLVSGLNEWGGSARPTPDVAKLMGFGGVEALLREGGVIARKVKAREPLSAADWRRALFATEIVFVSDLVGSGVDWATTTGLTDEQSIRLLRDVQRKLVGLA